MREMGNWIMLARWEAEGLREENMGLFPLARIHPGGQYRGRVGRLRTFPRIFCAGSWGCEGYSKKDRPG